uniref:Ankyrin repeat and SOCS box containing 1 n=1 Tax=Oryzias sinensis TaxID=183150 RepID=A0A8C7XP11_9TELE
MADGPDADEPPSIRFPPLITVSDLPASTPAGRNLKEWLQEQFCNKPLEQEDMRLHNAAYVGDLDTLRNLLQEDSFRLFNADVDMDHQLGPRLILSARTLNTLVVCPLYISAAYHHLQCFRVLLRAGAQPDFNYTGPVCHEALARGLASCLLDAVLRHGCDVAFVHLLLDHGANPAFVSWGESELQAPNRRKVEPEALKVFLEAKRNPRRLVHLCRIRIRRTMGKKRLNCISSLPVPDPIKNFLLHQN